MRRRKKILYLIDFNNGGQPDPGSPQRKKLNAKRLGSDVAPGLIGISTAERILREMAPEGLADY
jgi:hypothetical protein